MGKILFAVLPIALLVGAVCVLSGCGTSVQPPNIQTPWGDYTSGTLIIKDINLDDVPPAKDYTGQLEK